MYDSLLIMLLSATISVRYNFRSYTLSNGDDCTSSRYFSAARILHPRLLTFHILASKSRQAILVPSAGRTCLQSTSRSTDITLAQFRDTFIIQDTSCTRTFLRSTVKGVGANGLCLARDGNRGRVSSGRTDMGHHHCGDSHGHPKRGFIEGHLHCESFGLRLRRQNVSQQGYNVDATFSILCYSGLGCPYLRCWGCRWLYLLSFKETKRMIFSRD
jgi:hypothetical protein